MTEEEACPICGNTISSDYLVLKDESVTHEKFSIRRCAGCQLLSTYPRPAFSDLGKYYQSEAYISHTGKATGPIDALYLIARNFTLRWKERLIARITKHRTLLDYGCGTGDFLLHCQTRGWTVSGVEPSKSARDLALKKNVTVVEDIHELSTQFDMITLWHVLEHVHDLNETIALLSARLSTHGHLVIAVPNPNSWDSTHYGKKWAAFDVPRHLWHFSKQNIRELLSKHSFHFVSEHPMLLDAYYVSLMSERYQSENGLTIGAALRGFFNGVRSNRRAVTTREYSSMIYVFRK